MNTLAARRRTSSLDKPSFGGRGETRGGSAHGGNENSAHNQNPSHHHHHPPLAAIADALSGAVDAVARGVSGGRFAKLATSLLSSSANLSAAGEEEGGGEEGEDDGGDAEAEGGGGGGVTAARQRAAVALRSQDSIGIAHARFAKERARAARDEAEAEGCLDDVVDEHVRRTVAVRY